MTSVTIPNSVTTIGSYAFYECSRLTDVTVSWTRVEQLPTIGFSVFRGIAGYDAGPSAATLHVPAGTKAIYQAANQWKEFGNMKDDTALPMVHGQKNKDKGQKIIHNGQLIIDRNGQHYSTMGERIK